MAGTVPIRKLAVVFLYGVAGCLSLEITRISVPNFVPNGTADSVTLDCEYSYSLKQDQHLVVRWFHENDPFPVYQWIPELDSRIYHDKYRLDEDYTVPLGTAYTRSRAIQIRKPTTELSGRYKCEVQSHGGGDAMEDKMIVYALPTSVGLNYTIANQSVRVTCEVSGVYPIPEMSLWQIPPKSVESISLNDTWMRWHLEKGAAYDVAFFSDIPEADLPGPYEGLTFFGCTVAINGTEYEKEIKVPYFPNPVAEKQEGDSDDDGGKCHNGSILLIWLMALLLLAST